MKRVLTNLALLVALLSCATLRAAEQQFSPGRIVTVEKKAHERVLYYLGNNPVIQEDPYYEISLQQGSTVFSTEYTPRHAADELPDTWKDDSAVEMKITDKRHVSVRSPGGSELSLLILKRTTGVEQRTAPKAAPVPN